MTELQTPILIFIVFPYTTPPLDMYSSKIKLLYKQSLKEILYFFPSKIFTLHSRG